MMPNKRVSNDQIRQMKDASKQPKPSKEASKDAPKSK